ncbi:MAG: phospholipase D family protein [Candidatus Bathyarchaeia archaeon]
MGKSRIIYGVIVVLVFITGFIVGYVLNSARLAYANSRVEALQSQVELLQTQVQTLAEQNSRLDNWLLGNMTYYETLVSNLKRQLEVEILGVYFSPKGGCAGQVINWINRANTTIHILIYSFTLDSIGEALINAYNRGVKVKVIFEKEQLSQYSEHEKLRAAGIEVRNDTNPSLMHHKVMIIDSIIVLTGSFNWSDAAENRNNENLIIIKSTQIAEIYEREFEKIWSLSAG